MTFVLEWRCDPQGMLRQPAPCVISHIRIFRTVAALKAFASARRFRTMADEVRISVRSQRRGADAVTTSITALLQWDPHVCALPPPLVAPQWDAAVARLAAREALRRSIDAALIEAHRGDILSVKAMVYVTTSLERALAIGQRHQR